MPNKCGIVNCGGNYNLLSKCRVFKLPIFDPERQKWLAVIPPRRLWHCKCQIFFCLWEALAPKSSNEEITRWNNKTSCCTHNFWCTCFMPVNPPNPSSSNQVFQFEVVKQAAMFVEQAGGTVLSSIADNHKINQLCCKMFHRPSESDYPATATHPLDGTRSWYLLFDTVHLLKCIRSNWVSGESTCIIVDLLFVTSSCKSWKKKLFEMTIFTYNNNNNWVIFSLIFNCVGIHA